MHNTLMNCVTNIIILIGVETNVLLHVWVAIGYFIRYTWAQLTLLKCHWLSESGGRFCIIYSQFWLLCVNYMYLKIVVHEESRWIMATIVCGCLVIKLYKKFQRIKYIYSTRHFKLICFQCNADTVEGLNITGLMMCVKGNHSANITQYPPDS